MVWTVTMVYICWHWHLTAFAWITEDSTTGLWICVEDWPPTQSFYDGRTGTSCAEHDGILVSVSTLTSTHSWITTNIWIYVLFLNKHFLLSTCLPPYTYDPRLSWHVLSFRNLSFEHLCGNFGDIPFVPLDNIANKIYEWDMWTYYNLQTTKN